MQPEHRFTRLLDELASDKPAPASGSAAAAVVAAAAALLEKVGRLSPRWEGAVGAVQRAHELRLRAEELVEEDKVAYFAYVAALRSRQGVEDARSRTIDVPLDIARCGIEILRLADELARKGNQNLHADAGTAAILAHAAISAGAMLVQVNVGVMGTDHRLREAQSLMREATDAMRIAGQKSD